MDISRWVLLKIRKKKRKARLEKAEENRQWKIRKSKRAEKERISRLPETIAKIRRFPPIELTRAEFEKIPKTGSFTVEWLQKEAPFDFKFICKHLEGSPKDLIVLGHLVKGMEANVIQYGAGLSVPEKFINRFRVIFTD